MRFILLWIPLFFGGTDGKKVCFPKFGCFANTTPFRGENAALPSHPDVIKTKFYLYTSRNPQSRKLLNVDCLRSITRCSFDPMHKTIFIVHGFSPDSNIHWVFKLKDKLLKRDSFNVVNVDWRKGAAFFPIFYSKAVANSRLVGAQIAHLVELLHNMTGALPDSMHIVGHSLGAHIGGDAGRRLSRKNLTLGRITGLDPAKPSFEGTHVAVRLDKTDAKFVDVIHSNTAPFLLGGMGYRGRLGHVDFYPNGGEYQPGCSNIFRNIFQMGFLRAVACNHMRAVDYFIASIANTCRFIAFKCSSWEAFDEGRCYNGDTVSLMGYDAERFTNAGGPMYLKTVATSPFCAHNYIITIFFSKSRSEYNDVYVKLIGTKSETKKECFKLSEGAGKTRKLVTSKKDIGTLTGIQLIYYRFNSMYIHSVQVTVVHTYEKYTACFHQQFVKSWWSFWQIQGLKYERKAFVGKNCTVHKDIAT